VCWETHLTSQPAIFQYPTRKRTSSQPISSLKSPFFAERLAAPRDFADFPSRDGASQPFSNICLENEADSSAGFPISGFQDTKSYCTLNCVACTAPAVTICVTNQVPLASPAGLTRRPHPPAPHPSPAERPPVTRRPERAVGAPSAPALCCRAARATTCATLPAPMLTPL